MLKLEVDDYRANILMECNAGDVCIGIGALYTSLRSRGYSKRGIKKQVKLAIKNQNENFSKEISGMSKEEVKKLWEKAKRRD